MLGGTLTIADELEVHRVGFGAVRITGEGVWGPPPDRDVAIAVLRRAVALGIDLIDTADSYGPGSASLRGFRSRPAGSPSPANPSRRSPSATARRRARSRSRGCSAAPR